MFPKQLGSSYAKSCLRLFDPRDELEKFEAAGSGQKLIECCVEQNKYEMYKFRPIFSDKNFGLILP